MFLNGIFASVNFCAPCVSAVCFQMLDRTTAVEPSPESLAVIWLTKLFYEGTKKSGQLAEGRGIFFAKAASANGRCV